jgi:hypothetical protein
VKNEKEEEEEKEEEREEVKQALQENLTLHFHLRFSFHRPFFLLSQSNRQKKVTLSHRNVPNLF